MRRRSLILALCTLCLATTTAAAAPAGLRAGDFRSPARRFHVPERLLLAIAYVDSHWRLQPGRSLDGGYGPFDLQPAAIRRAARLTGLAPDRIARDPAASAAAAAALLASARPRDGRRLSSWYGAVARVGGGSPVADEVYLTLAEGATGDGLTLPPNPGLARTIHPAARGRDYGPARWVPASPHSYTRAWRPLSTAIDKIVIHVTDSSWGSALSWFANPAAGASAHYVVRSRDGAIAQTVRERDIAWHAGNWAYNETSVGIEHEAFTTDCSYFTRAMYRASARLAARLVRTYGIPIDRRHIVGHSEVPDPSHPGQFGGSDHHTDPGPCWNWHHYLALVRADAGNYTLPKQPFREVVTATTPGALSASAAWRRVRARHGNDAYSWARPAPASDPAALRFTVPAAGRYTIFLQWPSGLRASRSAPIGVETAAGLRWLRLNERRGNGHWRLLGAFDLPAGSGPLILFARNSGRPGRLLVDRAEIVRP